MGASEAFVGDPIWWLIAGIAAVTLFTMLVLRGAARRQEDNDPLISLFDRAYFQTRIEETAEFSARASADLETSNALADTVLSGKLDHIGQIGHVWGQDTRAEAIDQVAQVMRAGVRKTDLFSSDQENGFTILAGGASEIEASEIARRLMQRLAHMPVPGMNDDMRLTARIAIAERHTGESDCDLRKRAHAALDTATGNTFDQSEDCIIVASDWEEIRFLPSPTSSVGGKNTAAA